jgi:hypothetical protein
MRRVLTNLVISVASLLILGIKMVPPAMIFPPLSSAATTPVVLANVVAVVPARRAQRASPAVALQSE